MPPYPPGIPAGAYTANDVPTSEGALQLAMEQTEHTLQGASCLVIGYGRIGALLNRRYYYFVPFRQDAPDAKPRSLVADMERIPDTVQAALQGRQLQPLLLSPANV